MTVFKHNPNANGTNTAWTNDYTAVDEGMDSPTDGDSITAPGSGGTNLEDHELEAAKFTNSDYVKNITIRHRVQTTGSGTDRIDIRLEGTNTTILNEDLPLNTLENWRACTDTYRDLGTNYVSTFANLTMTIESIQQGMSTANGHELTAWDAYVEVFEASPAKGKMAHYAEAAINTGSAGTATFLNSHTAKSGNILIAAVANGTATPNFTTPTGYTLLQNGQNAGNSHKWAVYWKVSDGTETGVTINLDTGNYSNGNVQLYEIEWSGGDPTVQSNKDQTDDDTSVTTHTGTAITPDNGTDNAVIGLFLVERIDEWDMGLRNTDPANYDFYAGFANGGPIGAATRLWTAAVGQNRSGSQQLTWETDSVNEPGGFCVSVMVVLNADAGQSISTGTITENETLFAVTASPGATTITTGTITENETLFSPTAVPGTITIATGTITENETLFAVTAVPGVTSITTGTITENETLFPVTVVAGGVSVTTGTVTENEILFSATPVETQSVATGTITENETLFAVTVVPGATTIATGTITENETLFSPTAVPGTVTISTGTITENETLFSVTAVPGVTSITTGTITENETLFPVTVVAGGVSVTTGTITENETLFAVTVSQGQFITTGTITENETLFPVTVVPGATSITTGTITENETLFAVTAVAGTVTITTGTITENETLFAVTPVQGQIIATGTITENETLFAITAVPGATTIATGTIAENESLFSPTAFQGGGVKSSVYYGGLVGHGGLAGIGGGLAA